MTRRQFIAAAAVAAVGGAGAVTVRSLRNGKKQYELAVRQTWRHGESDSSRPAEVMRELVRYATLAPSSHNTQCWRFRLGAQSVSIRPDYQRRCPVVDPDDHHLFISLGCAAENFMQAAAAMGFRSHALSKAAPDESIEIFLEPARAVRSPMFQAIPSRQATRAEFDAKPLLKEELKLLEAAGAGPGVQMHLVTDRRGMETVLDFVIQGNTAQMRDPAFVHELKQWIRFNGAQAVRLGDGLFSGSSGNPSAPTWLGSLMFDAFFTEKAENDKYARHIRSSAGVAVFVSEVEDKAHWVEVGRAFERFALQATVLGVRTAHLNQPIEVASLRPGFAGSIGLVDRRPDLVVRFGRGAEMPRSLRRPVDAVIEGQA